jgi:glutathione S-transferase
MIDFAKYPAVKDYLERMKQRPAIARALAEEFELYKAEIARHKKAA